MPRMTIGLNGQAAHGPTKMGRVSELYNQGVTKPEDIASKLGIKLEAARSGIKRGRAAGLIGPVMPRVPRVPSLDRLTRDRGEPYPVVPILRQEDVIIRAVRAWMEGTPEDGLRILSEEITKCQKRLAAMESAQKMIREGNPAV